MSLSVEAVSYTEALWLIFILYFSRASLLYCSVRRQDHVLKCLKYFTMCWNLVLIICFMTAVILIWSAYPKFNLKIDLPEVFQMCHSKWDIVVRFILLNFLIFDRYFCVLCRNYLLKVIDLMYLFSELHNAVKISPGCKLIWCLRPFISFKAHFYFIYFCFFLLLMSLKFWSLLVF